MEEVFPEAAAVQPPDLATLERTQPLQVEAPPVSLGTLLRPARLHETASALRV